ncbi:MAG: hypothetical protein N3F64_06620 [Nitrososphaeria archaeon]|nr:hypothetical protein [Nitrososphaeria archaeon]
MYAEKLENAKGFDEIFALIKSIVAKRYGLHRAGLGLVLADLPPSVLGLHEMGSNSIVMNRKMLEAIALEASNNIDKNAYIFVVLLHEYLHSFGFYDERRVREMVLDIVEFAFGKEHPAYRAAVNPLSIIGKKNIVLEGLNSIEPPTIIKDFDRESMPFIG